MAILVKVMLYYLQSTNSTNCEKKKKKVKFVVFVTFLFKISPIKIIVSLNPQQNPQ